MALFDDLTSQDSGSEPASLPTYITAADNHNLGSQGNSWFSDVTGSISRAPEFMAVSAISGLNSFYNTGVKVGNFFGADLQTQDTAALISGLDSNLGQYYTQNQKSADLMGFLATSLIPGIGGVKILNAGQKALVAAADTGLVGSNLGLALGLRATQIDSYVVSAAREITQGQAVFSSLGTSGIKALSAGVYQNVLEGIAFETAVQATMQASPILEGQDKSDILFNIAMGGVFQGVLGGAIGSAKIFGDINKGVKAISQETQEFGSRDFIQEMNKPANKIIRNAFDLDAGPASLDPADPLYAQKVAKLEQRQQHIALDMRANVNELTIGTDRTLARLIADSNVGESADNVMSKMLDAEQITRLSNKTKIETEINDADKKGLPADPTKQLSFVKLTGEGSGDVFDREPIVKNLADLVKETEAKGSSQAAVLDKVRDEGFKLKNLFDASKLSVDGDSGHLTAEKRFIWAGSKDLLKEIPPETAVHMYDIPVLQRAADDMQTNIKIVNSKGDVLKSGFTSVQELKDFTVAAQKDLADSFQKSAITRGTPFALGDSFEEARQALNTKIGKITNTRVGALEGTDVSTVDRDYNALKAAQDDYNSFQAQRSLKPQVDEENDVRFMPTWAKISRRVTDRTLPDGHVVDGLTLIKTQEKLAKDAMDRVVAKQLGMYYGQLPELTLADSAKTSPQGVGAGMRKFSNPEYGDVGSKVAQIGSVTQRATMAAQDSFAKVSEGVVSNLGRDQEAVIEWGGVNQKVSRSAKQWIKHTIGDTEGIDSNGLIAKEAFDPKTGELLDKYVDMTAAELEKEGVFIPVTKPQTWNMINTHMNQTAEISQNSNERAAAFGKELSRDPAVFRPIPPDVTGKKFIAFVKDPKVTEQGHTSMIFADDAQRLEALVSKAQQARPDLEVYYKQDTAEFKRARADYQYDRALSDNYIDSSLKNNGIYSDYFIKTDPQAVVNDFVAHHSKLISMDVKEGIRAKYQAAFDWFEDQAKAYSRIETSRFGGNFEALEQAGKNPYLSYIKTALNITRTNENPLWYSANKVADEAVSTAVGKISELWDSIKGSPSDQNMTAINAALQKYGLNTGYYDAATNMLVNHVAPKNELSKFVRGANAVLSRLTLGLDPLNALNNAIGANILRGTELTQITDAIKSGDSDLAGKLAALAKVDVTGQGDNIFSPAKLMKNSFQRFWSDRTAEGPKLMDFYRANGFVKDVSDQFKSMIDDLTLDGTENVGSLNQKLAKAIQKSKDLAAAGERGTGNKFAEEFNRFISADVMKQLTDLAQDHGLMDSKEALSYINTFVNRVEGNTIASQRPFVFQGPIGQAVGLFQSYQFNLMQQLFRYVSEGSSKDAAMLLGLQGTFYGVAGLPAFQAINQHIIGTMSGNKNHVDAYDSIYGIAGKNLGDLLTYGLPSNLLQTNLYSRGDINPRQVTVIPTALNEVPVVGAFTKLFSSLKDTADKIVQGGSVWESLLQGIEHNGISRPLAGMAQVLQAAVTGGSPMSTTSKGDILFTNDLVSLATLSRLAGGRPLDEAIVNDGIFRIQSYQQYDAAKKQELAEAIKSSVIAGRSPESEQWSQFAGKFAELGGKQTQFNKFMIAQIKTANTSQAQKIVNQLQNPYSQKVQLLMQGPDLSTLSAGSGNSTGE